MNEATNPLERSARIAAILDEVIELPAADRDARVEALCGGDATLRELVHAVLAHDEPDDEPFRSAVGEAIDAAAEMIPADAIGQRLGPYRLVRELGRGGMGTVYLAAREDREFEQHAAIKVVRGLLGSDGLRRFRAERQILASLVHFNIARLLDGGTTPDGVPYFVMEYVEGVPLDQYCRDHRLSIARRLALFLQVCDAVAYAHRRLVVHRDLKPSNILVTADGVPKLLDFGVAKLVEDQSVAAPVTLNAMGPLFTPEYASPEQVRGDAITTASDVYSLGVLLHELLTARRLVQFKTRRPDEIARVVCEQLAPKPSTMVGRPRDLAGDLDTIVLAALEKDPARRYASVDALAGDVRRHLAGEPILVRPSTVVYRTTRFVGRHRWAVGAAAVLVLLLAGWAVTLNVESRRAARERDTAQEVTSFLVDLFASSDPNEARSADITARELIDRGAMRLNELDGRPAIQARLMDAIARVYRSLGAADRAAAILIEARRLHERVDGADSPATASTINELAEAYREQDKYEEAEVLAREALAIRERALGPSHAAIAQARNNLALVLRARGQQEQAEQLFQQAVEMWRATLGPRHLQVAVGLSNLSLVARDRARYDEAEQLVRQALDIRREALRGPHPQVANSLMSLGQVLDLRGHEREAEPLMLEALEMRRGLYGEDHPLVDVSLNNLASLRQDLGDLAGAEPLYRAALAGQSRRLGRHPDVAVTTNNLASLLEERGSYVEAEALFREALALRRETLGDRHIAVARGMHNLARLLWTADKLAEAETIAQEALALRRSLLRLDHPESAQSLVLLGVIRAARGDRAAGESMVREALAVHRRTLGADHPTVLGTEFALARLLLDQGRPGDAEPILRAVAGARAKRLPEDHWLRAHTNATLGRALAALGRTDEAAALMDPAYRTLAKVLPDTDERVRRAQDIK